LLEDLNSKSLRGKNIILGNLVGGTSFIFRSKESQFKFGFHFVSNVGILGLTRLLGLVGGRCV